MQITVDGTTAEIDENGLVTVTDQGRVEEGSVFKEMLLFRMLTKVSDERAKLIINARLPRRFAIVESERPE